MRLTDHAADVKGLDVVDLGCGTGYWCAWFAKLGARPVGLDVSENQLATARAFQEEHGTGFEVEALHDLYAPDGPPEDVRCYARRGWALQWPCEEVWVTRRRER